MTGKMWTNRGFGQEAGNVHNPTTRQSRRPHIVYKDFTVYRARLDRLSGFMEVDEEPRGAKKHLLHATEQSLYAGIDAISGDGTRVGDISAGVEAVLKKATRIPPWPWPRPVSRWMWFPTPISPRRSQ